MDKVTEALRRVWAVLVACARWSWSAVRMVFRATWAVVKWSGRVALWILCWPIGLWRSFRHGKEKDMARLERAIAARK